MGKAEFKTLLLKQSLIHSECISPAASEMNHSMESSFSPNPFMLEAELMQRKVRR